MRLISGSLVYTAAHIFMKEQDEIIKLKADGYTNVWVHQAEPGEIDEEHSHSYDTKLLILRGSIRITFETDGESESSLYQAGSEVVIPRNVPHAAIAGDDGCRYVVAEKH
jgi:quercetin dioxygenase-like cupin family protein